MLSTKNALRVAAVGMFGMSMVQTAFADVYSDWADGSGEACANYWNQNCQGIGKDCFYEKQTYGCASHCSCTFSPGGGDCSGGPPGAGDCYSSCVYAHSAYRTANTMEFCQD